ncbi:hypothetical protein BKA62DRAFT_406123 [Auriculariales sp. MPI-PUGE-AT-0066]|nr:hypothetical protein BKA62DRAFT_406123 [Auriculariales sp. MPI-PUGE-AT-0066]
MSQTQNPQYLTRPSRRSSRSNSSSSSKERSTKEQQKPDTEKPYTPVFQPGGYAYKIALPSRPAPGQTPWPGHLPPVVGPALGEATNRVRKTSMSHARVASQPVAGLGTAALAARARSNSMTVAPPTQPAPAPVSPPTAPAQQQWVYGLNPLLAPGGGLLWTLRSPVSYIKIRATSLSTPGPLTYSHRLLPVVSTRGPIALTVSLPGASLRVQADTLGGLLDALSDAIMGQASPAQWAAADQRSAAVAYRARCGADQTELAKGVRRVDLLGLNAAFAGIVPTAQPNGSYEWVLRVVVAA